MNDMVKGYLISLGYNNEDIENILTCNSLKDFKEDTLLIHIKDIYNLLISLGYSRADVIKMTKSLPSLYSLSIENIKQKITFLREIQLDFIVIEDTKQLMQSIDLTYARYMFFKDKGIEVTRNNYRRLFYGAKTFEKQYGIDKSTLLEKYNYQEYLNSKNNTTTL